MHPKQSRPVVCAGAGFHADGARGQIGNEWQQLIAGYLGFNQLSAPTFIHAMHRKNVLGEIYSNRDNAHAFPSWWC